MLGPIGSRHPLDRRRRRSATALALAAIVALSGCMTGQRPYFDESPTVAGTSTGDANIDAVLTLLDQVSGAVFTAEYRAILAFGGTETAVRVAQSDPARRSTTIGDIRYLIDGTGTRTCTVSTATCTQVFDAAAVSNTGVTPDVVFGDMAKRLRRDAASRIGLTTPSTTTFAGQQATCVDVPVSGGTKQYCALADGVLARYVGGDLTMDLTAYEPIVDESLFSP